MRVGDLVGHFCNYRSSGSLRYIESGEHKAKMILDSVASGEKEVTANLSSHSMIIAVKYGNCFIASYWTIAP